MKTECPHCGGVINPAALLAAAGKGGRKNYSAAERKRRAARMAEARKARWAKSQNAEVSHAAPQSASDKPTAQRGGVALH